MAPGRCRGGEGDYRPGIPLVVVVPLSTGQQIDYPYYGYYYGTDVVRFIFLGYDKYLLILPQP